nr:MAG TPA: hypothetical protein [Caudoviricetes sp.]
MVLAYVFNSFEAGCKNGKSVSLKLGKEARF